MFLLNSLQSGSLRRRFLRSVFALCVLVCLSASFLLTGCSTGEELQEFITTIRIDTSAGTIEYEGSYKGEIVNTPDFSASSGVLIIRFTKYADFFDPEPPSTSHSKVGKYGALYWAGLQGNTVRMADAFTGAFEDSRRVVFENRSEADTTFTPDNDSKFIDWSRISVYTNEEADGHLNGVWVNVVFF